MKGKKLVLFAALLLLTGVNILFSSGILFKNEPNVPEAQELVSDTNIQDIEIEEPVHEKNDVINWNGWQRASVNSSNLQIYYDEDLTQSMSIDIGLGEPVVICQRHDNLCKIRYRSVMGWTKADDLLFSGEPITYTEVSEEVPKATNLSGTDLAAELDNISKQHDCIGVQIAVITDGNVSSLYEYGYGNRGQKTPMTSDTKIRAASVSKIVLAMGIMSMQDMGLLDIDEDIGTYWGTAVRNPKNPDLPITLRHILTHTSSMKDFGYKKRKTSALESNLQNSSSYFKAPPGSIEAYKYNNSAICTAGAIAGRAANCNFDRYICEYFFDPLSIDASFHAKNIKQANLISPTYNDDTTTMTVDDLQNIAYYGGVGDDYTLYAGGLIISAHDLARMMCILIGQGSYDNSFYLTEQSVDQMLDKYYSLDEYEQCLVLRYKENFINGENLYYHNGNLLGVFSLVCFSRETGNGMVIITNGSNEPKLKDDIYDVCRDLALAASDLWNT